MSKSLVETKGQFQLIDGPQLIPAHRPAVVEMGHFFQARAAIGQIRLVAGDLKPEATDAEFAEYWKECKGDKTLAVESFLSKYGPKAVVVNEPDPPSEDGSEDGSGTGAMPQAGGKKAR